MTPPRVVLAVDQGTSGTKAVLVDRGGEIVAAATRPLGQTHPAPGRVEQDPDALWSGVVEATAELVEHDVEIVALALSTQRESVLAWDAATGEPLGPLLSWQDRRGDARCAELTETEAAEVVRRTGLPIDPMFSASKLAELLAELDPRGREAARGRIRVGTVDAWLLRRITGRDATEIGNASRTQLLDLDAGDYHPRLLELWGVPRAALAPPTPSTGPFGAADAWSVLPRGVPVAAVLGDSHAALFVHDGGRGGVVKATYGSGSSLMALESGGGGLPAGLGRTIAWQRSGRAPELALEANIAAAGTTIRWAAGLMGTDEAGLAELAARTDETAGVVLVPAFDGLGAPYWDRSAVAVVSGFTQATGRAEVARAAVESIGHQVADTVELFDQALGTTAELHADGGASANPALMQFQADLCQRPVVVSARPECSALGAAALAGLTVGFYEAPPALPARVVRPEQAPAWRAARVARWRDALARARLRPTSPPPTSPPPT